MGTLKGSFGYPVGYSDHTQGIEVALATVALGATIIEKHFILAGDMIGKIAVINDCLSKMEARKPTCYDMVVDLNITLPLRTVNDLEKVIEV